MARSTPAFLALLLGAIWFGPAQALCSYDGVLYAHPTVEREFGDDPLVVHVRAISAFDSWRQPGWSDDDAPWTLTRVQVLETFKGQPLTELSLFTFRNSGAFYTDDVGGEYLLFLEPVPRDRSNPREARGAWYANYCGNSGRWAEVSATDLATLRALKAANPRR